MNKFESASILAGMSPNEEPQVSEPTNLHVITGEVVANSENGTVLVSMDGLVFSEDDTQYIEMDTIGGLEEGDEATIILAGETGSSMTPLAIGSTGSVDRLSARVVETELLIADKADIEDLEAATARIGDLEADHVSVSDFSAEQANIDNLQAATADIDTIRANSAKVQNLTAAQLEADHAKVGQLDVNQIAADHATIGSLDTTYMHANMSNSDVAWISNGTIKDGAITNAMINSVSANKLTAGTIDASNITVTNLNASNITTGTINGQRIGEGSLSLDKLSEDVYTEAEVNTIVDGLNDRIDGAIETFTGTAVPTLNNSPASAWNTTALKDEHVGDVYYVVNSQSQQNGYCYRFTKSGSTYSWQLIKDSDVTAALSRLTTAEGKITSIESFDSTVSSFMTNTDSELTSVKSRATSLETRMTDAEGDISEKVDASTFNTLSQTVDGNSASITSMSTVLSNNGLTSSTNITNTVNTVSQTATGNSSKITQLTTTLGTNADGTTKAGDVMHRTSTVEQDLSGFKTTVSRTYATKEEFADLEIGGRNLFASSLTSNGYPADKAIGAQYSINGMSSSYHECYQLVPVEEGASYVFQYWVDNSEHPGWICIQLLDSEGIIVNKPARVFLNTDYLLRTFTIPSGVTTALVSGRHLAAGYEYAKLKFEKGTKPTDWTPAPEDIETRVSSAESAITQNAQNIELKVSKDGVISSINQSAETVKIKASQVEIDGTAVFNAISDDVDDAITSKGYQTSSQVNSAITSKGYQTASQVSTTVTNAVKDKADKSEIPTKVSELTNDANYATTSEAQGYADAVQSNLNATRSWYATSSTAAGTAVKVATITPATTDFALNVGTIVNVEFTATNSAKAGNLKLNVNGTGEKSIKYMYNNKRDNLPGTGYLVADIIYQFMYDGEYWTIQNLHYNTNTTYNLGSNAYYRSIKAKVAITAEHLIVGDSDGYSMVASGSTFDLTYPILWCTAAVKLNATDYAHVYLTVQERNILNSVPDLEKTLGAQVWLVGTVSGNTFTVANDIATCVAPSSEDGLIYIPIGSISSSGLSTTDFFFVSSSELWTYIDGAFRQVDTSTIVASHRIYYRTQTASSTLAAPAAWVEEATGNVYNQWTTKVPPMAASTAAGQTKYLYLYTCEQRKRLDGTTVCTKVLLDENTTVIDGGQIITHSITANQIAANTVTANEIDATDLHVSAANIDGTLTASQINASGLTIGQSQVTGLTTTLNGKADTSDIPTNVSDLTNDSGFQTSSQVESAITGKGYQTLSQVNTAITSKGYQTSSQVNTAITSKGYQTSTQVESAITSKGYATTTQAQGYATTAKSEAISAAATDATTKANAAAKTATSYVTEITGQNGIMVHPSTDDYTGVRITSDVDIRQDNVSIANFGALDESGNPTARLGKADDYHVGIDTDSLDVMDGTTTLASFGSEVLIGPTNDNHIEIGTMTNGSKGLALCNQDAYELEITPREFFSPWSATPFTFLMQGGNQSLDFANSGVEIWALGEPVESNYAKAILKLNARIGTANQVGSFTFQTNAGSNTWSTPAGTVLWSGGWHMTAGHTANLTYNVSTCPTGIVLHFQPYTGSTVRNYNHIYYFVPKEHVASYNGTGIVVRLGNPDFSNMASKYLYISNDHITGNDINNTTGTNSGITYNNAAWVMTQVIAV